MESRIAFAFTHSGSRGGPRGACYSHLRSTRSSGMFRVRPNMRLKLAAPAFKGIIVFVFTEVARRSLSAIR